MELTEFVAGAPGRLVEIAGSDPQLGSWRHRAFVPDSLPSSMPPGLMTETYLALAESRAALAALDNTARQLPNPTLLRLPTLRREAQSTSALEGTYAPLAEVLIADESEPPSGNLQEILNYVQAANHAFAWIADGRPLTPSLVSDLQGLLMHATRLEAVSGRLRDAQVVIGQQDGADPSRAPVHNARFVPAPPGHELELGLRSLVDWIQQDHTGRIDPVVAAAMSHYQFETLHPFPDGNGRIGRLLIVLHLQLSRILTEPTLTVSPWFESRRSVYYQRLHGVSTRGDWDAWIRFFCEGLAESADGTRKEMLALVKVQSELKDIVKASPLRAESAQSLVDLAVANPTFTVRKVEAELAVSYGRANRLVTQLVDLEILRPVGDTYRRRFFAPRVFDVLTRRGART